jgi:hypothetical protein
MRQPGRSFFLWGMIAIFASVATAACGNLAAPKPPLGHATVQVVDSATNAGVANVLVTLITTDGTPWAALRTSSDGTGEFRPSDGGVIIQGYKVEIEIPTGYSLAANETNDKPLTVAVGQTSTATFKLHKVVAVPAG